MRVLYIDWPCFGKIDVQFTLEQNGHEFVPYFHEDYQKRSSEDFNRSFRSFINDTHYDFCFSFNFYPIISDNCKALGIKYVAVVYDNPYVMLYTYQLINPNNYVFLFDKQEYLYFKKNGIPTVHYITLPVNSTIIDYLLTKSYDRERLSSDISFVGSLYHEQHNLFDRLSPINDYTKGYLDAIMEAQLHIQGYNFIEELLTADILKELERVYPYVPDSSGVETPKYIYAYYFICRKLTSIERRRLLTLIAEQHPLKLFTIDQNASIPHAQNMGVADYYSEMPYVFANSKINLNITLRSIRSGIPLRAMDIMGAGGFLLTNYQEDFFDYFIPNEDFVYYESQEDLLDKINYYLSNETKRKEIAINGHNKVKENHSFQKFFEHIFHIIWND